MDIEESGEVRHSLPQQQSIISELLKTQLADEKTWYLIDVRWFKQWQKYVGFGNWDSGVIGDEAANPGPIDNSMLFTDGTKTLKANLTDELDYVLVPKEAWQHLVSWYGLAAGQEPLERHVIEQGMFVKHHKVEVYFLELKLSSFADLSKVVSREFSHNDTIVTLENAMRELFEVPAKREIALYNNVANDTYEPFSRMRDGSLQDAGLYAGQKIVIEVCNEDGSWPRPRVSRPNTVSNNTYSTSKGSTIANSNYNTTVASSSIINNTNNRLSVYGSSDGSSSYSYDGYRSTTGPGLCGLSNLGNTCFMNSALQCMSNVPPLTTYMIQGQWQNELNRDNPLGMHGEIAKSYAELIGNMWSGKFSYTIPRAFKIAVGRFKPEFSGYQQQDSQELMAFLLDGLHEDLNRIKRKPYIETKEANNRPDKEVAIEAWSDYVLRNDSIIVDIFHGLLKSTLVCPDCCKVSVKFDPFCYLSLPLPVKKERQIEVILVPWNSSRKLRQYKVTVQKMGVISHLCKALEQLTNISHEKMLVVDVYNHRFHKVYGPNDPLTNILDRDDIFVYEVPINYIAEAETMSLVPVYLREDRSRLFGLPLLIVVEQTGCMYDTLYNAILERMVRYVHPPENNKNCRAKMHLPDDDADKQSEEESISSEEEPLVDNGGPEDKDSSDPDNHNPSGDNQSSWSSRIFQLSFVNIYGNAEITRLADDDKQIKFGHRTYLAADWSSRARELYYDEKLAEDLERDDSVNAKPAQKKQCIQLSDCLDLFTTKETLGEHDLWFCPVCKRHMQATKKFDLWQLPRVLVIHLKRFSYTRYWRDKIDTLVEYPTRGLDLSRWIINSEHCPAVYDLIAVSNHYGGMGGGHYTAFAKNHVDGGWHHFDDSSVSASTEDSVVTKAGYVLVYMRRDEDDSTTATPITSWKNFSAPATLSKSPDGFDDSDDANDEPDSTMEY